MDLRTSWTATWWCVVIMLLKASTTARKIGPADPFDYLAKFGYLPVMPPGVAHDYAAVPGAIRRFQKMTGLRITGRLDKPTRKQMQKPRCGLPDVIPIGFRLSPSAMKDPRLNPHNYYVPGYKWQNPKLSWRTVNYSPDLPQQAQRRTLHEAFKKWSDVAGLKFREVSTAPQDIEIKFVAGEHGDGAANAFDGPGGTLAHAYYPENGDTHFDEDELWTLGTHEGINLLTVATHELGHALGLGHSQVQTAVMAPYYQGYDANFKLHEDDISGIQQLYGEADDKRTTPDGRTTPGGRTTTVSRPTDGGVTVPTEPTPTTTMKPKKPKNPKKPNECSTKFDAVLLAHDGHVYVFRSRWIWRLQDDGVAPGFPRISRKLFQKPPSFPGAAVYSMLTTYTYFFKARKVYKYYGFRRLSKKRVMTPGYPRGVQAALSGRDGRIYIFKNDSSWIFDETTMDVVPGSRQLISQTYPGIPSNIDAVIRHPDNNVYFIKRKKYYKFYEITRRVVEGYPKDKAGPWMGRKCLKQNVSQKCRTIYCVDAIKNFLDQDAIVPK